MGSPNTGLSAVLAPRALEANQVPRDGADRPPHAVPLGHHLLRLADAQAVAVHGGCEPASGRGSAACGQRPGQLQLAVPACLYLNHDDVHVPSLGQAARAGQPYSQLVSVWWSRVRTVRAGPGRLCAGVQYQGLIRRSTRCIRPAPGPYPQVSVRHGRHSPARSGQSVRSCERSVLVVVLPRALSTSTLDGVSEDESIMFVPLRSNASSLLTGKADRGYAQEAEVRERLL